MRTAWKLVVALLALLLLAAAPACNVRYRHEVEPPGTEARYQTAMGGWVRYDGYDDVAGDLEVAVADFTREDGEGPVIRMVGVVHMGDGAYYGRLQEILDQSDLVLYEGVRPDHMPEGTVDPSTKLMWGVQSELLGLRSQVEAIDYDRPNWRQVDLMTADMGPADAQLPPEATARLLQPLETVRDAKQQLSGLIDVRRSEDALKHRFALSLIEAGDDPEKGFEQLAEQVGELRQSVARFHDATGIEALGSLRDALADIEERLAHFAEILIVGRNVHVMDVLDEELEQADPGSVIAVFYGAGHMPDFEERLAERGYIRGALTYYDAWAMNTRR